MGFQVFGVEVLGEFLVPVDIHLNNISICKIRYKKGRCLLSKDMVSDEMFDR